MSNKVASVGRSEDYVVVAAQRMPSKRMHFDAIDVGDAVVSVDCSADCVAE